jgi:nicotinate-nucleotide pyrophosphorylase (carboxylating)
MKSQPKVQKHPYNRRRLMNIAQDPAVQALMTLALEEDLPKGDVTTEGCIEETTRSKGAFITREPCVVAGLDVAAAVFARLDNNVIFTPALKEGSFAEPRTTLAYVEGPARALLSGERTALNFMQRLCGVATNAKRYTEALAHTNCRIVDTRKTTPGWRRLEKYAAQLGGAKNHRADLSSGIMIKDNHIVAAGSITNAIKRAKAYASHLLKVECEVTDLKGLLEAIEAEADVILLDNMKPEQIKEAVRLAEEHKKGPRRVLLEASGGINLQNIAGYAEAGADIISSGAITHSAPAIDIGLDFIE